MTIYVAHRDWGWPNDGGHGGRREIKTVPRGGADGPRDDAMDMDGGYHAQEHHRQVRGVLLAMTHGMRDYLSVPLKGTRDIYLPSGRRVRMKLKLLQKNMLTFVYLQIQKLTLAIEVLKEAGASPAPPSRARWPSAFRCSWPRLTRKWHR